MLRKKKRRKSLRINLKRIRDYVRLNAPEPEVLRIVGEESKAKGTDWISPGEIDRIVHAARGEKGGKYKT